MQVLEGRDFGSAYLEPQPPLPQTVFPARLQTPEENPRAPGCPGRKTLPSRGLGRTPAPPGKVSAGPARWDGPGRGQRAPWLLPSQAPQASPRAAMWTAWAAAASPAPWILPRPVQVGIGPAVPFQTTSDPQPFNFPLTPNLLSGTPSPTPPGPGPRRLVKVTSTGTESSDDFEERDPGEAGSGVGEEAGGQQRPGTRA